MKKYNIIKLFVALTICLSITVGCSNSLDEIVYSSVTEQNYEFSEEDFIPAILTVYPPLRNIPHHWGFWTTQEATTDAIVMPPTATGWDDGGIYRIMHYHLWNSEHRCLESIWNWFYQGVLLCNNVIEQIENGKIPAPSTAIKEQGLAELRTIRAYYYWLICDNFGDAPLVTTMEQVLPEKTSRKEIYDFIVSELNSSILQLSETHSGEMYGRMNRWAGKALLANVYLNAEVYTGEAHWEECIAQCDEIMNSGKFELSSNYKDSFKAQGAETSKEILFTIPFDKVLGAGNIFHMVSWQSELRKKFNLAITPWGSGTSMAITQFIDTYQEGDSRLDDTWLHGQQYDSEGNMLYGIYEHPGEPFIIGKDIPNASYVTEMQGYRMNKYEVEGGTTENSNTD
ncbi:MAG: RagB/SusD family nutrient uptake outer membrane protein, partial [Tannerellaceae bacterium]|nr:RagB/SusD family nutrient uptake outer membrane protein [Tannerellaceae bacterium]